MEFDEMKKSVLDVMNDKRWQWIATIAILLVILFMSSSIRLSNWDLLTDSTTGEKIPLALDPYYFLRVAETIVDNDGKLPEFDRMRAPGFETPWHWEIMPRVVVGMWKISSVFGEYSIQTVNIFSPVFFYGIGLILFFILVYVLTCSKLAGVLASAFLAFTPAFLYRTMAGFSDHEAIGIAIFFLAMLTYALTLKYLDKLKKKKLVASGIVGLIVGLVTAITVFSWGGVAVFLFMIIPISFLLFWVIKLKDVHDSTRDNGLVFYLSWIVFSVIFVTMFGMDMFAFIGKYVTGSYGIASLATLGFIILDRLAISVGRNFKGYNEKYRILYVLGALIIAGIGLLPTIGKNFFAMLWEVLNKLLNPFWMTARLNTTVAENSQPYLVNWIGTVGTPIFWLFVFGMALVGLEFSKNIKSNKNRYLMIFGYITLISGILFSRISPTSILNGVGIFSLSGLVYLGGIAIFVYAFAKNYTSAKIKISPLALILFAWTFVMLIVGRSSTRMFFVIAPFMCLCASYLIVNLFKYLKEKKLKEVSKILAVGLLVISIAAAAISINDSYNNISNQAKYTGPSANAQWQNAMSWVRENTSESSVFSHWWDYGYWVQTLGRRASIADGGHAQGVYDGNHKIGRYILTTPYPETALSMFKTLDVDYLLIDQTDLGKYPAYSKIGGGDGENELDRYAAIPVMPADAKQTVETANGTMIVFTGGTYIFEDIVFDDVFLPAGKAAVVGIILNLNGGSIGQPEAVYVYNNVQTRIPVRYVYINGEIIDFGSGLDVTIDIIPAFDGSRVNPIGAAIYLSQKVSKSLFAQLFLMDDPFGNYETIELAHTEASPVVASLKSQGVPLGDFVYYQGFRGPIKIWNVEDIPEEIKIVPEIKEPSNGTFGALDGIF